MTDDDPQALILLANANPDPYPIYERLRKLGSVHGTHGGWLLLRHRDVAQALKESRCGVLYEFWTRSVFGDHTFESSPLLQSRASWMLFMDPPEHDRLRGLVSNVFTRRAVEGRAARVRELIDEHLTTACDGGTMDVIGDFAYPLTVDIIGEVLGVPRSDRARFMQWGPVLDSIPGTDRFAVAERLFAEYAAYFGGLVERKRREPGDDLISRLVEAQERERRASANEVLATALTLYGAGFDTPRSHIGLAVNALLDHPDQLRTLRDDPRLVDDAVEELLRFDSPVQVTTRTVLEDLELGGHPFKRGDLLFLNLAAANRDPEAHAEPERLNVRRSRPRPLTFGGGTHYCVAAALGRLESRLVLTSLLKRCPGLRRAGEPTWETTIITRGLARLPVAV